MKRFLLALSAVVLAASANATVLPQQKVNMRNNVKNSAKSVVFDKSLASVEQVVKNTNKPTAVNGLQKASTKQQAKRKSVAGGLYYTKPAGVMYRHFGADGYGYGNGMLTFPSYTDILFENKSAAPEATQWFFSTTDFSKYADEKNDMPFVTQPLAPGYSYPVFTLTDGKSKFAIGENGIYKTNYNYEHRMAATTEITPMSVYDDHGLNRSGDCGFSYYGFSGFNGKHYLFGTGFGLDEKGQPSGEIFYGVLTDYAQPISPLYVESIDMPAFSFSETPIAEGKALTMKIINTETEETVYTLTATTENLTQDLDDDGQPSFIDTEDYGNLYEINIHFANVVEDVFGTLAEEPFTIDFPYTVVITGFEQEGVDVGLGGCNNASYDTLDPSYILTYNPATEESDAITFKNPITIDLIFNALFDHIENYGDVEATDGETYPSYYVEIAADGASSHNAIFGDLDGALVYTGTAWFTEDGSEQYSAALDEWITSMTATFYGEEDESETPSMYTINFEAEPLPEGVAGRGQFVYILGRGVEMELPIFVFQGDPEAAWEMAGVNSVVANKQFTGKTYNLAGQVVNDNYKGIVIKNGKKYIK